MGRRATKALSSNIISNSLRQAQTRDTGSLPVPALVAGLTRNARSGANDSSDDCSTTHRRARKNAKPSTKSIPLDDDLYHIWRVSHLVSWADLLLRRQQKIMLYILTYRSQIPYTYIWYDQRRKPNTRAETLRARCGEDGVGRRKSGPTVYRATSGRLA